MVSKRVFITGVGVISALGNGWDATRSNLLSGKSGISEANHLKTRYVKEFPFGEINQSTEQLISAVPGDLLEGISRTEVLALIALNQAISDAGLGKEEIQSEQTSLISASSVGGMSQTDSLHHDANLLGQPTPYLSSYNVGEHINGLTSYFGIKGLGTVFNTACSSSANAIMFGARLIKTGRAHRVLVGGADALAKFTVNGFNSLQILSSTPCKPFDVERDGLNLGEGAAYLVLESEDLVGDKDVYAEVSGYGNASDAFHPSAISDEAYGVVGAISAAIQQAAIEPTQISYVNAHGTGTQNNDLAELTGMNEVFNGQIPPFQSTKTYTGHTLAAAGSIEAVISLMVLKNNELYPTLNCSNPISDFDSRPIQSSEKNYEVNHVLSNSFGFAGNCSSLIFSKV